MESQIRAAIDALIRHDADAALRVIYDDARINEVQRKATAMIAAMIATQAPVARDLRYLLTLDHVSYELERMGDHAAAVAKQARKLAPEPPLKDFVLLPELGRGRWPGQTGIILALVDIDAVAGPRGRAADDEVDDLYHRIFDEVLELMRDDPDDGRPRGPDPVRRALPRADRRPGDEHRRGHRVPGLRRGRGPQSVNRRGTTAARCGAPVRANASLTRQKQAVEPLQPPSELLWCGTGSSIFEWAGFRSCADLLPRGPVSAPRAASHRHADVGS